MKTLWLAVAIVTLSCFSQFAQAANHPCLNDAKERAEKLLALHSDNDDRASIDANAKVLAPIKNPSSKTQKFDVIEVMGYVYKAQFRIHLLYGQIPGSCVLVGQEILELTTL
jgi:hypothetical protein